MSDRRIRQFDKLSSLNRNYRTVTVCHAVTVTVYMKSVGDHLSEYVTWIDYIVASGVDRITLLIPVLRISDSNLLRFIQCKNSF